MNKELIERLARETWLATAEIVPHCDHHLHFATRFLSAYLAERGKEAGYVWQFTVGYPDTDSDTLNVLSVVWDLEGVTAGTHDLFRAPQIPEGLERMLAQVYSYWMTDADPEELVEFTVEVEAMITAAGVAL